jgi:hypothetical protein
VIPLSDFATTHHTFVVDLKVLVKAKSKAEAIFNFWDIVDEDHTTLELDITDVTKEGKNVKMKEQQIKEIFGGDYSRAINHAKDVTQLREALYFVCCRLQEFEAIVEKKHSRQGWTKTK